MENPGERDLRIGAEVEPVGALGDLDGLAGQALRCVDSALECERVGTYSPGGHDRLEVVRERVRLADVGECERFVRLALREQGFCERCGDRGKSARLSHLVERGEAES